jgi:hypothetical protein
MTPYPRESLHGNGNGTGEKILAERRFTLLEAGQVDHSRRITQLERGHASLERRTARLLTLAKPAPPPPLSASNPWLTLAKQAAQSAGQWIGGILAMAYVMHGGDLLTALQTLLKFF